MLFDPVEAALRKIHGRIGLIENVNPDKVIEGGCIGLACGNHMQQAAFFRLPKHKGRQQKREQHKYAPNSDRANHNVGFEVDLQP